MVVILTPKNSKDLDCHEVGRSFCTLMSSKYLQKKCYSITSKEELLNAVTDFECESFVLPDIGNWEDKKLLSYQTIQELRERTRELRGNAIKLDNEKADNDYSGSSGPGIFINSFWPAPTQLPYQLRFSYDMGSNPDIGFFILLY